MSVYSDVKRSLFAYCNQFLTRHGLTDQFETFDFDSHTSQQELPNKHLIGIMEYSIQKDNGLYSATCMIMVCTLATDAGNVVLEGVIDKLFNELGNGPGFYDVTIVDSGGVNRGLLSVMDDIVAFPAAETRTRPLQGIATSWGVGYATRPS